MWVILNKSNMKIDKFHSIKLKSIQFEKIKINTIEIIHVLIMWKQPFLTRTYVSREYIRPLLRT